MTVQLDEFERRIAESGLMTEGEVCAFIESLPADVKQLDSGRLAQALVRAGQLTPYQAHAIYLGKGSQLTLGNYVLLGKIGKGGMGVVFKAMHRRMHRVVAIKVLSRSSVKVPSLAKRFKREVRAVALLDHPNIVTAYDADESAGRLFLVMQYIDGDDLSSIVRKRGPLPVSMAISCLTQAARGLEYAHHRGVVHRDVKPSNLFLGRDGILRVLDLGLARIEELQGPQQESGLTDTGLVMGSVDFMAPEQAADMRTSDARSDIYSFGYTLWYVLTGKKPYPGSSPMERLVAHWERPLPSLCEACPQATQTLETVFHKMVAKRPEDRYQTMTQVVTELERARTAESAGALTPANEHAKEDEELSEFLQVLGSQAYDSDTLKAPSSGQPQVAPRLDNGTRPDTARRSGKTLRQPTVVPKASWKLTRRSAVWIAVGGILAILLLAFIIVSGLLVKSQQTNGQEKGKSGSSGKSGKSASAPPVAGRNARNLLDKQMSEWNPNDAWTVENIDGHVVLKGKGSHSPWLSSKKSDYTDYTLWLDYRLNEGADSGLFVRGRFVEVQIGDDQSQQERKKFTGALSGIQAPTLLISAEPDYDPRDWHAMIVQVSTDRVRVWIDKKLVTDAQCDQLPNSGSLVLESAPEEVYFRNMKIQESSLAVDGK